MSRAFLAAGLVVAVSTVALSSQTAASTPESTIRALVTAIYKNDLAAYIALTIPDPRRSVLTMNGRANDEKLRQLQEEPQGLQIKLYRGYQFQGKPATPDAAGMYPIGTTVLFMAAHYGQPIMVTLVRKAEGWRVDLRWWIAMADLAGGLEPKPATPDLAIKSLVLSLLSLNRKEAARWVAKSSDVDILFQGAPLYREPSGVLEASAMEMPLVRIGPDEFYPMPSGRVVEGSTATDVQVLVGMFGPTEIPFVVRRAGSSWRVDPEPYFMLLNR